jgi:hypothetical protein
VNNTVADGLSRFCPDERTLLGKTKSPNSSLKEAGSSLKGDEDNLEINKDDRVSVDVQELWSLDVMDKLSLPRLLISQRISNYTKYTEQIELWNLSVLVTKPLSDSELKERINGCHNDIVGHHGVNRTLSLVKSSPRIQQAIANQGSVILKIRQRVKKFIQACLCCQKMCMD